MRELRRLVGEVAQKDIKYALSTDLNEHQAKHYLPVINCRECGQTGWASVEDNGSVEIRDIRAFYNAFFSGDSKVRIMFPHKEGEESFNLNNRMRLCPECMEIMFDEPNRTLCSNGHKTIPIWVPDLKTEGRNNSKAYKCPFCNGKGTMSFIGLRSATAISAGIAVFTDGYYYHKDIVEEDTLKRMAIMLSRKYRVWSLTYKDVHNVFKSQETIELKR